MSEIQDENEWENITVECDLCLATGHPHALIWTGNEYIPCPREDIGNLSTEQKAYLKSHQVNNYQTHDDEIEDF